MTFHPTRKLEFGIIATLLLVLFIFSVARDSSTRGVGLPRRCKSNLRAIGTALHNYHDKFGCFPPAAVIDADGMAIQSWRALLWPQLKEEVHFYKYAFNEPWNSKGNSIYHEGVLSSLAPVFHCSHDDSSLLHSSYLAVVGENTAWPGTICANRDRDFPDGLDQTILVVEVVDSGIHWLEPRDLQFDKMSFVVNDTGRPAIGSNHSLPAIWPWTDERRIVNVLFADGDVRSLEADISPETWRALLTRNGGETIEWDRGRTRPRVVN